MDSAQQIKIVDHSRIIQLSKKPVFTEPNMYKMTLQDIEIMAEDEATVDKEF